LLAPAAGATYEYEDVLPAGSAGALSSVGGIVGRDRVDDKADGGYMEVEGTPLPPPGRQDSDVSLIAGLGITLRRLSSESEL